MPVTRQKRSILAKPFKWWFYIAFIALSVIIIGVVSSVLMHAHTNRATIQETIRLNKMASQTVTSGTNHPTVKTQTPVIGILTQVLRDYKRFAEDHHLHMASSYVKWIEGAGAQVIPVLLNQNDSYYEQIFRHTNGLLFPGGDNLLDPNKNTPMMVAAKKLYKLAVDANDKGDYYPIWGTCLGLELLSVLTANKNVLESCSAIDEALPMQIIRRGKLFAPSTYSGITELDGDYSGVIMNILIKGNLTYNYHIKCLTDSGLEKAGLTNFYRTLAHSVDKNHNKFIAMFEAINYPFFGVQFHPEKPPFEFVANTHEHSIPHSRQSIAVSRYFADFFVQQAQLNGHVVDRGLIDPSLVYAYQPMYTGLIGDIYEQRYLFPFGIGSTEEFLEHIPDEHEIIPEDVTGDAGHSINKGGSDEQDRISVALRKDIYTVDVDALKIEEITL